MNKTKRTPAGDALTGLILDLFRLNNLLLTAGDRLVAGLGLTSARWQILGAIVARRTLAAGDGVDDRGLRALFQQRLEIRPRALRFALGGLGGLAEAEIAVDEAEAVVIAGRHAGGGKRVGVGLALVAERIEPGGRDDRRRYACEVFGAQRRDAPVGAVRVLSAR